MVFGHAEPRISTPDAAGPLTTETTSGYGVLQWLDENLSWKPLPWQKTVILRAHELNNDGSLRYKRICVLCGRQSGKSSLVSALACYWLARPGRVVYKRHPPREPRAVAEDIGLYAGNVRRLWQGRQARREWTV